MGHYGLQFYLIIILSLLQDGAYCSKENSFLVNYYGLLRALGSAKQAGSLKVFPEV